MRLTDSPLWKPDLPGGPGGAGRPVLSCPVLPALPGAGSGDQPRRYRDVAAPDAGDVDVWLIPPARPVRRVGHVAGFGSDSGVPSLLRPVEDGVGVLYRQGPVPVKAGLPH